MPYVVHTFAQLANIEQRRASVNNNVQSFDVIGTTLRDVRVFTSLLARHFYPLLKSAAEATSLEGGGARDFNL